MIGGTRAVMFLPRCLSWTNCSNGISWRNADLGRQGLRVPAILQRKSAVSPIQVGGLERGFVETVCMEDQVREQLESTLGYQFREPSLLVLALSHASNAENRVDSNERLEFLGDAVLGLVTVELTFRRFPMLLEGDMTKIKSHAVSRETCARIAERLGLEQHLVLGKGMLNNGVLPSSLAAAALEAVIGAIYLDGGFDAAAAFVRPLIEDVIERAAQSGHQQNFKSVLQQHAQQTLGHTPTYRILDEKGPDHAKCFKICVEVGARRFEPAWGQTKKKAEQDAALQALRELGVVRETASGDVIVEAVGSGK